MAGQDGNLAVRLGPDRVLVTPTGVIKALVGPADMVEVDLRGAKQRGRHNPTSEYGQSWDAPLIEIVLLLADESHCYRSDHDGNRGRGWVVLQLLQHLPAFILLPYHKVQDDEVGVQLFDLVQILKDIPGHVNLIPILFKDGAEKVQDLLRIIDNQNALCHSKPS